MEELIAHRQVEMFPTTSYLRAVVRDCDRRCVGTPRAGMHAPTALAHSYKSGLHFSIASDAYGHSAAHPAKLGPRAFALVELLTVMAVIGVLASLLPPALSAAKARARDTKCVSNFRQFSLALQIYTQDHRDRLPPNADGQDDRLGAKWVEGWLGLPGPDCTNILYLRQSLLAPYLGRETSVWQCPEASQPVRVGNVRQPRVRTLSLNCFLGSPVRSPVATTYRRMGEIVHPGPADMITFIDERADTINDGSFALQWAFDETRPAQWTLRDKPGARHRGAATLAFADGHVERHLWQDARTTEPERNDVVTPGNADILWLQRHATHHPGDRPQ